MLFILSALALLSAIGTHLIFKWYTSPWHILVFVGIFVAWEIIWEVIWWGGLFLWSLTVDKKKEVTKPSKFFRWIFVETVQIALFFLNVHVHVEGKEKLPAPGTRFLVVANHLSNYDPMSVMYALKKHMLVFVSKPENFNIPLVGAIMHKSGFMAIDRDHVKNAIITINKAADRIKTGETSVFIFPEGTRNRTEEKLLEFKNGAFKIATKAKCPLVVLAVKNTNLVKKRTPFKHTTVIIKVVDVIPEDVIAKSKTAELSEEIREKILAAL